MFSPICLESREILFPHIRKWNCENSDLTFTNLFLWQKPCNISYEIVDGTLLIVFYCNEENSFMLPPLPADPESDYRPAMEIVLDQFKKGNRPFFMRGITHRMRAKMEQAMPGKFVFEHEPDTDDYVYDTEKLISLSGKKLHSKRNHINKFLSFYDYRFEVYDQAIHAQGCLDLNARWSENKDENEGFMSSDDEAISRALLNANALGLSGAVVYVNNNIEAFTLSEQITDDMALVHIEKANNEIQGLYPFINQRSVEEFWSHTKFINREEDMGVENIRKAKESYAPLRMIEKFKAYLVE